MPLIVTSTPVFCSTLLSSCQIYLVGGMPYSPSPVMQQLKISSLAVLHAYHFRFLDSAQLICIILYSTVFINLMNI